MLHRGKCGGGDELEGWLAWCLRFGGGSCGVDFPQSCHTACVLDVEASRIVKDDEGGVDVMADRRCCVVFGRVIVL